MTEPVEEDERANRNRGAESGARSVEECPLWRIQPVSQRTRNDLADLAASEEGIARESEVCVVECGNAVTRRELPVEDARHGAAVMRKEDVSRRVVAVSAADRNRPPLKRSPQLGLEVRERGRPPDGRPVCGDVAIEGCDGNVDPGREPGVVDRLLGSRQAVELVDRPSEKLEEAVRACATPGRTRRLDTVQHGLDEIVLAVDLAARE